MPSLQEIRQFNDSLVRLADEPSVLSDWGEEVEALPEPEQGLDTDLSSLLADTGDVDVPTMGEADGVPVFDDQAIIDEAAADERPDFAELLGDDEAPGDIDGADALFPDLAEGPEAPDAESVPGFDEVMEEAPAGMTEPESEEPVTPEAAPDEVETTGPEEDVDFSDFAALLGEGPVAEEAEGDAEGLEEGFAEPEPFDLPDFDEAGPDVLDEEGAPPEAADLEEAFGAALGLEDEGALEYEEAEAPEDEWSAGIPTEESEAEVTPEFDESGFGTDEFGAEGIGEDEFAFEEPEAPAGDEDESPFAEVAEFDAAETFDADESFESDGAFAGDEFGEFAEPDATGLDDFSLGDFGAEFEAMGEAEAESEEDLNPAINIAELAPQPPAPPGEFQLSERQFKTLRETLASLPLNLRIEVEGIVTEAKGTADQVEALVRSLAERRAPQEIADLAGEILGKRIRVPRTYEKSTGADFEAERQSFAYQFRHNILPILRLVAAFAVGLGILALAAYHLVYRPLYGRSLYTEGLSLIREDQYSLGNQAFLRGREVWPRNRWFYEYASAFIAERQYTLAGEKYEQLLFGMSAEEREYYNAQLEARRFSEIVNERSPEKRGVLEYAQLESGILGNYERADDLLQLILVEEPHDYEGWLAVGDNNMRWADEVPAKYEDARRAYARLIDRNGQTTELLFRMLTYFVRTDNLNEVLVLKEVFQGDPRLVVEPDRYAEMSGYLIDKGLLKDVEDMLFRAFDVAPELPQIHYHLARFYRLIGSYGEERVALHNTLVYLEDAYPLTARLRGMKVDALTRVGENFYKVERYIEAQESLAEAIEEYEEAVRRRMLSPDPVFGRAYALLGDIFYYVARSYDDAYRQYVKAEENGFDEPDLDYKQGFVLYRNGQMDTALAEFLEAAEGGSASTNALLWATANTYYRRANYFAAEAYYRELLDRVERQRDGVRTLLVNEDPRHQSIIEYLIKVNNNLGVALVKLAGQTANPNHSSAAMIHLTEAIEYAENYRRNPETMGRSAAVSMPYLNQREILYPTPEYSFQIYADLPEDLEDLLF